MSKFWRLKSLAVLLACGLTSLSAPAAAANLGRPGTINYVEGQVRLDGQTLTTQSIGVAELAPGQVLETGPGKVEVLLTPGVFLRMGDQSAIRMDSPALTDTRVAILRGQVLIEVTQLYKENNLEVLDDGAKTALVKEGLYAFQTDPAQVAVYDGEAKVLDGDAHKTLKKGNEALLSHGILQKVPFDRNKRDDLYNWSNLRSEYLSEASVASARTYVANTGGWYGGGWYWSPGFGAYSYLPGDGFLYSPFGWGFYSPGFAYYAPGYGYGFRGYRGGLGRVGVIGGFRAAPAARSSVRGAMAAPAFRRGSGPGSGGFHGGGFGGGRR